MIQKYVACDEGVCVSQRLLASHMYRLTATWYDKGIIKHYTVIVIVILPGGAWRSVQFLHFPLQHSSPGGDGADLLVSAFEKYDSPEGDLTLLVVQLW